MFAHGVSIIFLVTFSYILEHVVKILTGGKFDLSFFLKEPFSNGETKAILASSGKMSFEKCLIAFNDDFRRYKFRSNHIKTNHLFVSNTLESLIISKIFKRN